MVYCEQNRKGSLRCRRRLSCRVLPAAADLTAADGLLRDMEENMIDEVLKLKHTLRFKEDGTFKIAVFSDVHSENELSEKTIRAINAVCRKEKPDLVLFNGDLMMQLTDAEAIRRNIAAMTRYLEEHHIPWAHVYGNHDSETVSEIPTVSREEQQQMYEAHPFCLSKTGEKDIGGVGNYVLPILRSDSDTIAFNVWALDSGSYLDHQHEGLGAMASGAMHVHIFNEHNFAYIPFKTIRWYFNTSEELERYNGARIPAVAVFHMPLCEYYTVLKNPKETGLTGAHDEQICSSELNSGLFTAALDRGDIKMFVAGHDHTDDFIGEYCGIKLAYDASIGFQVYYDYNVMGARIIEINQDNPDAFTTRMSYLKDIENWDKPEN